MATRLDCFRALEARLRAHHRLRDATIRAHTGSAKDRSEPVAAECPWIRITPYGGDWQRSHRRGYETPLFVRVETATRGTRLDDHFALWEAIFDVLIDWEAAGWSDGISTIDVVSPAEGPDPDEPQPDGVTYSGRGLLRMMIFTEWT